MKKFILLPLFLILSLFAAAQWVTIPDANFANKLNQLFPECMDGNLMDTTCTSIVNDISLNLINNGIVDITGIQYFDNLEILHCRNNSITFLPELPNSLITLHCGSNELIELPVLPDSLQILKCYLNNLLELPELPGSLLELECFNNNLSELPELPDVLQKLICANNNLTELPELPSSLTYLGCPHNQITSLPVLPPSLTKITCGDNELTELPPLPGSLEWLSCYSNNLTELPELPNSLTRLWCTFNQITALPQLSDTLIQLDCSNNNLTELPQLPSTLEELICSFNNINCLPILPSSITTPVYPGPEHLVLTPNDFTCLPNYIPVMQSTYTSFLTYPLCDLADPETNPAGCSSLEGVAGAVYEDANANCDEDELENGLVNIPIKLFDDEGNLLSTTYTYENSIYNISADTGSYSVQLSTEVLQLQPSCEDPGSAQGVTLTTEEPSQLNVDFGLECPEDYDFGTQSIVTSGLVFPGQEHELKIIAGDLINWYGLQCSEGVSGSVLVNITGPVSYVEPANNSLQPNVSGDIQLTYEIDDFGNTDFEESFGVILETDTTAQAGDLICIEVVVEPIDGDTNPENNIYTLCYEVVNSYDPNIKEVWPQNVGAGYDGYFNYTIYFQNTGNAPAFNIEILDTLDSNLDLSTFEMTGYSHNCFTTVAGSAARFYFNNIMLPDSTTDFDGSIGYVQYRIKPIADLPVGTVIENTAHIFFDFNDAIVTNTTENLFEITTSVSQPQQQLVTVFPNPGTGQFNVLLREVNAGITTHLEVYNLSGQRVLQQQVNENRVVLNLTDYPSGMYLLHVRNENGSEAVKLMKQ